MAVSRSGPAADAVSTSRHEGSADPDQPAVSIRNLTKRFARRGGEGEVVPVDNVSLDISHDEMLVLLGPSGCGKTTLLRCVGGLEIPDEGEIWIGGELVFSSEKKIFVRPEHRSASMIFQSYALWPHMTVFENVAYPLQARRVPKAEITERVTQVLSMMGLDGLLKQYPGQISGGQQQRVALARALVPENGVILLDEPLSNVDAKVRDLLRVELVEMQRELRFSALYVTHDQVEAMQLADRIAVLNSGRVAQLDPPERVYWSPADHYVADFIGTLNGWEGTVEDDRGDSWGVTTPLGVVVAAKDVPGRSQVGGMPSFADNTRWDDEDAFLGRQVVVASRAESWVISDERPPAAVNAWKARIQASLFGGASQTYVVHVGDQVVTIWGGIGATGWPEGTDVWVSIAPTALRLLDRQTL